MFSCLDNKTKNAMRIDNAIPRALALLGCAVFLALGASGAVPPPDKLLPAETLALLTVTDVAKARSTYGRWATIQLWNDPALKPFKDKFMGKLTNEVVAPLEKAFGLKFSDYSGLAQGQCTLAWTKGDLDTGGEKGPGFLLLMDARDKSDLLKSNLADLKKKWVDSGKQIKTEPIRDVEFTTLLFSSDDLTKTFEKVFPKPRGENDNAEDPGKKPARKLQWLIGQSDSLFILGNSAQDIEKVLVRQSGGAAPALAEHPGFAANYSALFRDSITWGWVDLKTVFDLLSKKIPQRGAGGGEENQLMPRPDRLLSALGFTGLQTLALNVRNDAEGASFQLQLRVPESSRKGLFKILAFDAKDANPPPFVPADAVKFSRYRLDLPKAWTALENTLAEAFPPAAGVIKMLVDNAGKDKDPEFDLRKSLIANLGDDVISYQKGPRKDTLEDLNSPPTLVLISSPRAEPLAASFKALGSMLPQRGSKLKEREFLGRTVYVMNFSMPGTRQAERALSYAASGGYLALSFDVGMIEEYLRNSGTAAKALRDAPGLAEAAQKVGGMSTGLFGYENQVETMRATVEILRKESGTLANLFGGSPLAGRLGMGDDARRFQDWIDFSLLPPFEKIAKYFSFAVHSGRVTSEGFSFEVFNPTPSQLPKQ
jgi:hypothetical protein